jgi:hypothetical protein
MEEMWTQALVDCCEREREKACVTEGVALGTERLFLALGHFKLPWNPTSGKH